jgi:hypothetical protein
MEVLRRVENPCNKNILRRLQHAGNSPNHV